MPVPSDLGYRLVAMVVTLFEILDSIGLIPLYQMLIGDVSPAQERDVA
ncbi:MAG: hypothetical protein JRN12_07805 [Nitrososphaerota archaeon]|jgi:small neutral amino acid transporter SnatA (MarC family)|nr:hypothetical protein [Nitrososphaerota archaeon]MDG6954329.1 hypothetical protein [Nitrososphaerota archaeon]